MNIMCTPFAYLFKNINQDMIRIIIISNLSHSFLYKGIYMYIFWLHPPFVCLHIISIFYRKKIWHIISIVYFDDFVMTLLRWNGICDMRRWSFHSLTWGRPPVFLPLWVSLDMYVSCSSWCVHDEVGFRYIHSVRQIGCQWYDLIEYLSVKYDSH